MRMNLITESPNPMPEKGSINLSLTIKPACGIPGDYQFPIDSASLLEMLRRQTDLPASVLKRFEGDLHVTHKVKLLGVELSERVLTEIGYFIE
jgi:hypothetical protein